MNHSSDAYSDPTTLILGDWFVDEHWVCGVHRSSASSRTGNGHFRVLSDTSGHVQSFCGTGRTASLLLSVKDGSDSPFFSHLVGAGFWHYGDTNQLRSLFQPDNPPENHHRLTRDRTVPDRIELVNLNDAYNLGRSKAKRDELEHTTRIIRIYRPGSDGGFWFERFDWERPLRIPKWNPERLGSLQDSINKCTKGAPVSTVIIKDLLKGSITHDLIEWLAEGPGKDARWYVSSKRWEPEWLDMLQDVDLRLLFVPEVAANEAVRKGKLTRWILDSNRLSYEAIEQLNQIDARTGGECRIIVLPGGSSFAGLWNEVGGERKLVIQPHTGLQRSRISNGWASIFFPTTVTALESIQESTVDPACMLNSVLQSTAEWVLGDSGQVSDPDNWERDPQNWEVVPSILNVDEFREGATERGPTVSLDWNNERQKWDDARQDLGVVTVDGKKQLHLWRAASDVNGYVCTQERKRAEIRKLVFGINSFVRNPVQNVGCLLIGSPGSGKTFLVEQLAESVGLEFLEFNITTMSSYNEITSCFESIVERQESTKGIVLAYFDEINAMIGGTQVYGSFLTPMEKGVFTRKGGRRFHMAPCAWIFSGTERPELGNPSDKGADFVSRLTMGTIRIDEETSEPLTPAESESMRLEKVHTGVSILLNQFKDVRKISEPVLRMFQMLPDQTKIRDIKHFVKKFQDVQYSRVMSHNVPSNWPYDEQGRFYDEWSESIRLLGNREEDALVEIVS